MSFPFVRRDGPVTLSRDRVARCFAAVALACTLAAVAGDSHAGGGDADVGHAGDSHSSDSHAGKSHAGDDAPGISGAVSIEEGYSDNVRWDKKALQEGAWYTTFETEGQWRPDLRHWDKRLRWLPDRVGGLTRFRIYSGFGNRDYAEFGPTIGYDWDLASLTLSYRYSPDHLRVDPATTVDAFADVQNFEVELRSKFGKKKRWTALLTYDFDAEDYDPDFRERNFFEETIEAGLRCRATPMVTPRASFAYSNRDAISSNFDREEFGLLFGFDLYLPAGVRALFRYEKTWRSFLARHPTDGAGHKYSNYHRDDDAYNFDTGLEFPMPWVEAIDVHLRYRYRNNDSSRADRSYQVNEGSLKLVYDF